MGRWPRSTKYKNFHSIALKSGKSTAARPGRNREKLEIYTSKNCQKLQKCGITIPGRRTRFSKCKNFNVTMSGTRDIRENQGMWNRGKLKISTIHGSQKLPEKHNHWIAAGDTEKARWPRFTKSKSFLATMWGKRHIPWKRTWPKLWKIINLGDPGS